MLDPLPVGKHDPIPERPYIHLDAPANEQPVVEGRASGQMFRLVVARQPAVSALVAMLTGALAMAFVRNRLMSPDGALGKTAKRRRRQLRTKQP